MPFSPLDISPDIIWLDAQDTVYQERTGVAATTEAIANDDPVGTWLEKGSGGNYFTAEADAERPTIQNAALNGLRTVRFSGSNCLTIAASAFLRNKGGAAIVIAGRISTLQAASRIVAIQTATGGTRFDFGENNAAGQLIAGFRRLDANANFAATTANGAANTAYSVFSASVDALYGGTASNVILVNARTQGARDTNGTGNFEDTDSARICVGGFRGAALSLGFIGDIAEVVIVPRYCDQGEVRQIEDYLAARYAITLNNPVFAV